MRATMKRWEKIVCKLFKKVFWSRDRSRGNWKRNLIILLFFRHQKLQSSGFNCWQKPFLLEFILFVSTRPKPISSHIETLWVRGLTLKIFQRNQIIKYPKVSKDSEKDIVLWEARPKLIALTIFPDLLRWTGLCESY